MITGQGTVFNIGPEEEHLQPKEALEVADVFREVTLVEHAHELQGLGFSQGTSKDMESGDIRRYNLLLTMFGIQDRKEAEDAGE